MAQGTRLLLKAGQRFGMLAIVAQVENDKHGRTMWRCRCDCGQETVARGTEINTGHTRSCGCQKFSGNRRRHGMRHTKAYTAWCNMWARCTNRKSKQWKNYGGRGITVDAGWAIFESFYADMGDPPPGLTLDRIDNDGNYCRSNCRWADRTTQRLNSSTVRWITMAGDIMPANEAIRRFAKVGYVAVYRRMQEYGWTLKRAILTPPIPRHLRRYGFKE